MSDRITSLKEKFRLALKSTAKVISDDFDLIYKPSEKKKNQDIKSIEIDNLTKPSDFIKLKSSEITFAVEVNASLNFSFKLAILSLI